MVAVITVTNEEIRGVLGAILGGAPLVPARARLLYGGDERVGLGVLSLQLLYETESRSSHNSGQMFPIR